MKENKKYYKLLDIIRVVSCIGVLLYHLGYLKGGFLSVCSFFVLSGYLSYTSLSRKENVSLFDYYKNRFFHIYLPLLVVVFLTVCVATFMPETHWFQLKPETTSVLFGYNNYWQLQVNADYFARHVSSPFMHFWYIGILLQFELIFPFLYLLIDGCKKRIHKSFPLILLGIEIIASICYFIYYSHDIMISYYDTFVRVFSLLLGVLVGYIHHEYKPIIFQKHTNILFYFYLSIFILLQFIIDSNSSIYGMMMILVSFITCRLIDYGTVQESKELNYLERETKYLSGVSYEVYLFQYPIIFFFQYLTLPIGWKVPLMILLIFGISYFIHFSLDFKNPKNYYFRLTCIIFTCIFCIYGLIQYIMAKDYTEEMNQLRKQLEYNQRSVERKQVDYRKRIQEENEEWNSVLKDLENGENELAAYVSNLPITAVGDSVMLGAVLNLYQQFPNGYFDAAVSRTDYEANRILQSIKNQGALPNDVLIHLGTNGQCGLPCQREIMSTCENRNVYIVTVSNDNAVHVNQSFYDLASMYSNVTIIDWAGASSGHPEYFVADGVHLTGDGMRSYTQTIYDGIYHHYHKQYEEKKNSILKEHEEKENEKINFYGNQVLLNIYPDLQKEFNESRFIAKDDYSLQELLKEINLESNEQILPKKIVIAMDDSERYMKEDYKKIISTAKEQEIYFIFVYHKPFSFKEKNVHVIDFYQDSQLQDSYFMVDGIHLSKEGNKKLISLIQKEFKKKD